MIAGDSKTKVERELRRQLHKRLAWIALEDGITLRECHVLDLSSGGARIATDDAMDVRDRFELTLVPGHHMHQLCEVVWRRGKTYGIKFLTLPADETPAADDQAAAASSPPL